MHSEPSHPPTRRQALRWLVGGGTLVAIGGAVAACTGTPRKPDNPATNDPALVDDVVALGAVGDGVTDDTAAIQRALDGLETGRILQFPEGRTFCHNDVLTVRTAGVSIIGPGELRATKEDKSAFKIEADGVTVRDVTFGISGTTQRWSTPDQHKLFVGQVAGVTIEDVRITGSAAAGLFALGASDFRFEGVQVSDTRADGIHMTYGAHDGTVDRPVVVRSGDDGVAVVSYLQDGMVCHDIEIVSPTVRDTTWGRGISVVGGQDISYRDVTIERSSAASVYIACEGDPSNTFDSTGVSVTGGSVTGANTDADIDHGAVLVYSGRGGGAVDDIRISQLTIADTRSGASRQIGVVANDTGDRVAGVRFDELRLDRGPTPYQGNAPVDAIQLDAVTAGGKPVLHATVS